MEYDKANNENSAVEPAVDNPLGFSVADTSSLDVDNAPTAPVKNKKNWLFIVMIFLAIIIVGVVVFFIILNTNNASDTNNTSNKIITLLNQKYGNYNYSITEFNENEECHSCPDGAMCEFPSGCVKVCRAKVATDLGGKIPNKIDFDVNCASSPESEMKDYLIADHYLEYSNDLLKRFQSVNPDIANITKIEFSPKKRSSITNLNYRDNPLTDAEINQMVRENIYRIELRSGEGQKLENREQLNDFMALNSSRLHNFIRGIFYGEDYPSLDSVSFLMTDGGRIYATKDDDTAASVKATLSDMSSYSCGFVFNSSLSSNAKEDKILTCVSDN